MLKKKRLLLPEKLRDIDALPFWGEDFHCNLNQIQPTSGISGTTRYQWNIDAFQWLNLFPDKGLFAALH